MNKNKIIKTMIPIVIVIIIIVIALIMYLNKKNDELIENPPSTSPEDIEADTTVKECNVKNEYFIVKDVINKYYLYCANLNIKVSDVTNGEVSMSREELEKSAQEEQQKAQETIYNMLDAKYSNEFDITTDTIKQKFGMNNNVDVVIKQIYVVQNSLNVSTYFVTGILVNTNDSKTSEFNISVSLDMLNNTFSIYPQEYMQKYNYDKLNVGDNLEFNIESIENRNDNTFEYKIISDEEISQEYLSNYKYCMLYDVEYAYELLDEEYKNKRFLKLSDFQNYIKENWQNIQNMMITKYSVEIKDGYTQYLCVDNYQNNYIFKATSVMKYTVLLDNYTVETEEFKSTYSGLSESEKIATNIDKFIKCINNKDYSQAYGFLDEGFKNNYFKDVQDFKEYINNNFYDYNIVGKIDIQNEGNIFICKIPIKSGVGVGASSTTKTIIMQLNEGTDFVMSFSIE